MAPRDRICDYRTYGIYVNGTTGTAFSNTHIDFVDDIDSTKFVSISIIITNDSLNTLQISFDGTGVHGDILGSETLTMDRRREQEIWIRSVAGGDAFRFWAW